jgi:hypothetical protein
MIFRKIWVDDDTDVYRTPISPDGLYRRLKRNLEGGGMAGAPEADTAH